MAEQEAGHKHPDSNQRIEILEEQVKKLQQVVRVQQQKMRTHDHPSL
ncbi:MAG TPA: hypothetical protein VEH50_00160 [Methylomirabilota bacterium]|nr:hypothetical protein [Methylomirabilota bacterium]